MGGGSEFPSEVRSFQAAIEKISARSTSFEDLVEQVQAHVNRLADFHEKLRLDAVDEQRNEAARMFSGNVIAYHQRLMVINQHELEFLIGRRKDREAILSGDKEKLRKRFPGYRRWEKNLESVLAQRRECNKESLNVQFPMRLAMPADGYSAQVGRQLTERSFHETNRGAHQPHDLEAGLMTEEQKIASPDSGDEDIVFQGRQLKAKNRTSPAKEQIVFHGRSNFLIANA